MQVGLELVTSESLRTGGVDTFCPSEQIIIEVALRETLPAASDAPLEDLVIAAMWRNTHRPKGYLPTATALIGNPLWVNAFYDQPTANVIGFVHQAIGERFQSDQARLYKFQRPDGPGWPTDRGLLAAMDGINGTDVAPTHAHQNMAKRVGHLGVALADVQDLWHIQLHFSGRPGPENFFNAVSAVQQQLELV